jgi:hypothetical protein
MVGIALRLLLSLAPAMAGGVAGHAGHGTAPAPAQGASEAPAATHPGHHGAEGGANHHAAMAGCHGMGDAAKAGDHAKAVSHAGDTGADKKAGGGCCDAGACKCACMQGAAGAAPMCGGKTGTAVVPGAAPAEAPRCGHADAERTPLIRPPTDAPAQGA